jgi:RNA polymerase sigma factor (sigma-70 family)
MLARIVGNRQTAEDLAQEAYVRVAIAEREQPIGALQAFLFRTARNLALDHLRAERMHGTVVTRDLDEAAVAAVPAEQPTPEVQAFDRERLARFEAALAGLKPRRREILVLHKLHGWTYARIADHFGITDSAVQKNVVLALAECLANLPDDIP